VPTRAEEFVELTRADLPSTGFTSRVLTVNGYRLGQEASGANGDGVILATAGLEVRVDNRGIVEQIWILGDFSDRLAEGRLRDLVQSFEPAKMRALFGVEDEHDAEAKEVERIQKQLRESQISVDLGTRYRYAKLGIAVVARRNGRADLVLFPPAAMTP
jgi:hypothetical protein